MTLLNSGRDYPGFGSLFLPGGFCEKETGQPPAPKAFSGPSRAVKMRAPQKHSEELEKRYSKNVPYFDSSGVSSLDIPFKATCASHTHIGKMALPS